MTEERARRNFEENLARIVPPGDGSAELASEFLDRYVGDDRRIGGIRFGPTAIEVEILEAGVEGDLPAAFHGIPVVLRARLGGGARRPGPLRLEVRAAESS
jgi:hypothetical protein